MYNYKKWEELQLTLGNSKSEVGQGDYQDKTQKLLKIMRIPVIKCEFQRDQCESLICRMPSTRVCMEFNFLSIQVIDSQLCL